MAFYLKKFKSVLDKKAPLPQKMKRGGQKNSKACAGMPNGA